MPHTHRKSASLRKSTRWPLVLAVLGLVLVCGVGSTAAIARSGGNSGDSSKASSPSRTSVYDWWKCKRHANVKNDGHHKKYGHRHFHCGKRPHTPPTKPPTTEPTKPPTTTEPTTPDPTTTPPTTTPKPPEVVGGCAKKPSACGYPDASNTGVPSGTDLQRVPEEVTSGKGWHYDSRGWIEVDGDGAVLSGISTTRNVNVTGSNATIKNSRIIVSGESFGVSVRHAKNVTIQSNEIAGPAASGRTRLMVGVKDIYSDSDGLKVIGNDIWNTATGVQMDVGLIQDNYIHDLAFTGDDHVNGTTSNGGKKPLTIRHNTVFNPHDQTDAISLFQDFGAQGNRVIDSNLLAGGGYTIYAGANTGKAATATNISVTNNRISRLFYPKGGYFGYATAYTSSGGNSWSGNVWDDTGASIFRP